MVRVAIATALRQGEIRSLKVKDLRLDQSWLRVEEAKDSEGSRPRNVPLTPAAVALFREILAGPRPISGGVFVATTKDQVTSAFSAAAARAGLPEVTFHDLRHTATTRLAAVIGDPMELGKYTGHRSIQVLMRYYNPTAADLATRYAQKVGARQRASVTNNLENQIEAEVVLDPVPTLTR
jgi:integrase